MKKKKSKKSRRQMGLLPACLYGAGVGAVASVVLLIAFSVICTLSADPDKMIMPLSLCASGISFFACGFSAARRTKGALPSGALSAIILSVGFYLISLFIDSALSWGLSLTVSLLIRASFIAIAIFGAIIGKARG